MNHCECSSINDVDRCFKRACKVVFKMKKLLESVERSGGQIKFSSDENKFAFSRIASKEYSQV